MIDSMLIKEYYRLNIFYSSFSNFILEFDWIQLYLRQIKESPKNYDGKY